MSNGKSKGFVSSGIVVGHTPQSKADQKSGHLKGNKVTMGKNVPRQTEGAVGDITVRDVTSIGLRCYIKTDSGWLDINSLISQQKTVWIPMNLATSNWAHNTTYAEPSYFLDSAGFVHLRGGIVNASGGATDAIVTLPEGYRPPTTTVVAAARGAAQESVKILSTGVVNITNGGDTGYSSLDGVSFFAHQAVTSIGAGTTISQEQFPSGFPVL
jgi:hypothetical protein